MRAFNNFILAISIVAISMNGSSPEIHVDETDTDQI